MTDRVLTLAEASAEVKVSEDYLKRKARNGEGPFYKVGGRWKTYRGELHEWFRSHRTQRPRRDPEELDPMPRPRQRGSFREKVVDLEARRRAG